MSRIVLVYALPIGLAGTAAAVLLSQGAKPGAPFALLLTVAALLGATIVSLVRTAQSLSGVSTHSHEGAHDTRWARELTREKTLTLRSLRDLEFDHAMGKLSDRDFEELGSRLRARAVRIMKDLDERPDYAGRIERELDARLARSDEPSTRTCSSCSTDNDPDAKFCKTCGQQLYTA